MTLSVALAGVVLALWSFGRPVSLRDVPNRKNDDGRNGTRVLGRRPVADVSIVIPARNEQRTLPALLASIESGTVLPAEVIVVDDNSTDATSQVAREHGAIVVGAPPLPEGWLGKPWACHLGAQRAVATRLLFLDADVTLSPTALESLMMCKNDDGAGLLSVQPEHRPVRAYEQLSVIFNVVGLMACGAFGLRRVRPQRVAFGPCLLVDAAHYDSVGGHEAVRSEVIEDLALAGLFADAGREVQVLLGGDLIGFRMYPDGFVTLVDGWTKNIAAGASRSNLLYSCVAALWVTALASTALSNVVGVVNWAQGGGAPWLMFAAWLVAALQVFVLIRRVGRFHPLAAVFFAIPVLVFIAVFVRSASRLVFARPVMWRGRSVPSRPGRTERA